VEYRKYLFINGSVIGKLVDNQSVTELVGMIAFSDISEGELSRSVIVEAVDVPAELFPQ